MWDCLFGQWGAEGWLPTRTTAKLFVACPPGIGEPMRIKGRDASLPLWPVTDLTQQSQPLGCFNSCCTALLRPFWWASETRAATRALLIGAPTRGPEAAESRNALQKPTRLAPVGARLRGILWPRIFIAASSARWTHQACVPDTGQSVPTVKNVEQRETFNRDEKKAPADWREPVLQARHHG